MRRKIRRGSRLLRATRARYASRGLAAFVTRPVARGPGCINSLGITSRVASNPSRSQLHQARARARASGSAFCAAVNRSMCEPAGAHVGFNFVRTRRRVR